MKGFLGRLKKSFYILVDHLILFFEGLIGALIFLTAFFVIPTFLSFLLGYINYYIAGFWLSLSSDASFIDKLLMHGSTLIIMLLFFTAFATVIFVFLKKVYKYFYWLFTGQTA